ncbi:MAG TPA: hypothetical protein VHU87_07460 [Rhizomicrobium sp.]|jgi:hypothetical protein|nr:hypothetical protein [Rhizomicrobium sp.]
MGVRGIGIWTGLAVLLAAGAAQAQSSESLGVGQLSGNLTVDYDRYDNNSHSANQWNANGSAVLTIDNPGINLQINAGNSNVTIPKMNDTNDWGYGGDFYWRDYAGDFGVNVNESTFSGPGTGDRNFLSGGFFGEFFVSQNLTLRAKGGRMQGDVDGWYGDTGLVYYAFDAMALSVTADTIQLQHDGPKFTDGEIGVEYLPVRDVPISLGLNYTFGRSQHLIGGFGGDTNIFSIALKAYFGGGGRNGGLVDYQRNGATDWDGVPSTVVSTTF